MKLYVYADESGTFDKANNDLFVYGGVIVSAQNRKAANDRYIGLERSLRKAAHGAYGDAELKASIMKPKHRHKVFKALRGMGCAQFAAIVDQCALQDTIFTTKFSKQRYLDYALKLAIKNGICSLFRTGAVRKEDIERMSVIVDEHSTSTDGKYNLVQSINMEFRFGVHNLTWDRYYKPVFNADFPAIPVEYVDSSKVPLIRAADVTANWVYRAVRDIKTYPQAYDAMSRRTFLLRLP